MGYAQWIDMRIVATDADITLGDVVLDDGQFYDPDVGRKPSSLDAAHYNGLCVRSGTSTRIAACGVADREAGTKGSVALYCKSQKIGRIAWDCKDLVAANALRWIPNTSEFRMEIDGGSVKGAALGEVTLICSKAKAQPSQNVAFSLNAGSLGLAGL